ncbi:MAG: acetyl-CoA acetyltransferase, partial [Rhodospirillaceae bacterium]|nr:acetyl-CoA acetyltransferase [Rhodospirillaceae bacterium]
TIAVVKSLFEFTRNSPHTLAQRMGANDARQWITPVGGNMPQYAVNRFAEDIANGRAKFVLLAATEAMATGRKIVKAGGKPDWREAADTDPESLVFERELCTPHEALYDIWPARFVYPMFENALRGRYGHSIEEHQLAMGKLFARFSDVAADNPHAWYPIRRTAEEIARPSAQNRFVSWPYTKFMNAMNQVNQSAAVIMTSRGFAKELGVADDKMVYLHGCGDANELWHVSERADYATSPAIRAMGRQALEMAGRGVEEMDYIDIYACFPVAVQMARDELGIAVDDPRPLTITGGLPYHGGANAYVMNAIAAMVDKVRGNPGTFGIVTANGGYLTEHAAGIYSTEPSPIPKSGEAPWSREDPGIDQAKIDATPHPDLAEAANGAGVIETYTVGFGRDNQPNKGIVIGRLGDGSDPNATRFLANTPVDQDLFAAMTGEDFLGAPGKVSHQDGRNIFTPN